MIESGTIYRLCFVFPIQAVVLRTIWCNFKEASIATKQNSKIATQHISYFKVRKKSVLNMKMSKFCVNHWNGRINRIIGLVLNIAQVYPARPENLKSLGKPHDLRFSQPRRINLSYIQHFPSILYLHEWLVSYLKTTVLTLFSSCLFCNCCNWMINVIIIFIIIIIIIHHHYHRDHHHHFYLSDNYIFIIKLF